jgi:hypothetical protein
MIFQNNGSARGDFLLIELVTIILTALIPAAASVAVWLGRVWGLWVLVAYSVLGSIESIIIAWNSYNAPRDASSMYPHGFDPTEIILYNLTIASLMLISLIVLLLSRPKPARLAA